jgi:hypothetical protein
MSQRTVPTSRKSSVPPPEPIRESGPAPVSERARSALRVDFAARALASEGEPVVPFPVPRDKVPMGTHFRSTWLTTSMDALKRRDLLPRYRERLDSEYRSVIDEMVAGTWLPAAVAIAHYRAIDALSLHAEEEYEMGGEVLLQVHSGFLKLARLAWRTPWMPAAHMGRLWGRSWRGGAIAVFKLGPKEGRIEVAGMPICGIPYVRHATRGSYMAAVSLFCTRAYVHEIPSLCTASTLGYHISWI